jgi:selenocysteine-specific elongation factor
LIIATAGHVDHGKTLLVEALTGVDTDRLQEEKSRGLTIDLGFAYVDTTTGQRLGFVDVPGHIKFINNMLAGVGAVDYALLVLAADDGPMPQTLEHVAILNLLGVSKGAVALTKTDRVSNERVEEVKTQIHDLLAPTTLNTAAIYPVSSTTGAGIDSLLSALDQEAATIVSRDTNGYFRLAIDRSFSIKGSGIVVTGSVFSGSVSVGDGLSLVPANVPVRVRSLHTQNRPAQTARAGDRCAINIAGTNITKELIHRGNWLTSDPGQQANDRFDVMLTVLPTETRPLRHWSPVHIHCAANHVTGRVALLENRLIEPGEKGLVQVVTNEPINVCIGDQVIIRDQGAIRTIGGGPVIHSESPRRGRATPERIDMLHHIAEQTPAQIMDFLLDSEKEGVSVSGWRSALNIFPDVFSELIADAIPIDDDHIISRARLSALQGSVTDSLQTWHKENPGATGINQQHLGRISGIKNDRLLQHIIATLSGKGELNISGSLYSLPGHNVELSKEDTELWKKLEPLLAKEPTKPPVTHDLAKMLSMPVKALESAMSHCAKVGYLVRPVQNRFMLPEALDELKQILINSVDESDSITVKHYRDATGIGRNLAIEILEYFDRQGITQRQGDIRKLLRKP